MDAEFERMKSECDLRVYAASKGYQLDLKESWTASSVMRHPNNDKIIIKRDADGHYVYFSVRDDTDNGTILDFIQKRRPALSLGHVRQEVREFMGTPSPLLPRYPVLPKIAKDRIKIERTYARMKPATGHAYLEGERAIPRELLALSRFAGRIRSDARGNAVFPHYDADGLSGFEIKGPGGWTSFASGGTKGLWTSHLRADDRQIVFCESTIDALSHAALFPNHHSRYASLGGKPTPAQKTLVRAAVAVMPASSVVIAAMDADAAGREIAKTVREALTLAARCDLRFEIREPKGSKDWNDQLRDRRRYRPFRPEEPSVA